MNRMSDLERLERLIAARHRIPYDRIDRVWLRAEALKALCGEQQQPAVGREP